MSKNKKCPCGSAKFGRCSNCSKVKMWVGLKSKYKDFRPGGFGPVRYNYLKYNKYPFDEIVKGMKKRLEAEYEGKYNVIIFYDRQEGNQPVILKPTA